MPTIFRRAFRLSRTKPLRGDLPFYPHDVVKAPTKDGRRLSIDSRSK